MPEERRHAAIMFTDIVGYTALMGSDEDKAFALLKLNHQIHENLIRQFNGTLIKEIGDGTLASFSLASDAVRCAMEIQKTCKNEKIPLKIGIHEGEMVFAGADVLGDGVNIASRLQESADEGYVMISASVYRDIKNKPGIRAELIGEKSFRNVDEPIKVYRIIYEEPGIIITHQKSQSSNRKSSQPYFIIAGVALIIATFVIWRFFPVKKSSPAESDIDRSIAVLPFVNLSNDPDQEYFSDGMMDAILMHLYKIGDLDVTSRTSAMRYKKTDKLIGEIAHELGVRHILEGSVSKAGNKIRIIAQLIDAMNDKHLWAETYEQELSDVFAIQSDVAQKIASSLKAVLSPDMKKRMNNIPTENLEAYDYYLKGEEAFWQVWKTLNPDYTYKSIEYYKEAIDLDSNFSLAYAGLGRAYWMLSEGAPTHKKPELYKEIRSTLNKAIELDPYDGWAYGAMWEVNIMWDWDSAAARRNLDMALKLSPNDFRVLEANFYLELKLGNCDQLKLIKKSIKRLEDNVEHPLSRWNLLIMLCQKQFAEIARAGNEYWVEGSELHLHCYWALFWSYLIIGDYHNANKVLQHHFFNKGLLYYAFNGILNAKEGKKEIALAMIDSLKSSYSDVVSNETLATIQAAMGNKKEMYEYLNKAIEAREDLNDFMMFPFIPELIDCENDREFQKIKREIWIPRKNG
jgi:adenylate cyclase